MGGLVSKCFPRLRGQKDAEEILRTHQKERPRLTEEEILQQLRNEGIVPERRGAGGVSFSVGQDRLYFPKAPTRLYRLPTPRQYTSEDRQYMAELNRYDKLVEQVRRKAIKRDIRHGIARRNKTIQEETKKMNAELKLKAREERLKKMEEERELKKKNKEGKKEGHK